MHDGHSVWNALPEGQGRHDVSARGEHVRLGGAVLGDAAARERRGDVVAGVSRADLVGGADRDHVRVVARRVPDRVGRSAAVARGDDDDDPGVPGVLDGRIDRVVDVGRGRVRAHRDVHDADAELGLVVDHVLQGVDDVDHRRLVGVVGDLERDQVGLGSDADVGAVRRVGDVAVERVAGEDAGDVRAVAEIVA